MTTAGHEQTLQVARSFCPGGWVTFINAYVNGEHEHRAASASRETAFP